MIEFKLFEFFGILGVGTFAVLSLVYIIFEWQRLFHTQKHNENAFFKWLKGVLSRDYRDTIMTIVAAVSVYSAGIITQDVTDKLTDSVISSNRLVNLLRMKDLLKSEGELRVEALVKNETKLTLLGREVFENAHTILAKPKDSLEFFNDTRNVVAYWKEKGQEITHDSTRCKKFEDFVNSIYYTSKNWCYLRSESVRNELQGIQERIDFSRSILLIAYLDMLVLSVLLIAYYTIELSKPRGKKFMVTNPGPFQVPYKKVFKPLIIPVCIMVIYITRMGYVAAEKNFNERAMGYYVSQLKLPQEKQEKKLSVEIAKDSTKTE